MKRRRFLSLGTAVMAAPALPSVTTATAAPPPDTLPSRAQLIGVVPRVADQWIASHTNSGDNGWARSTFFSGLMAAHRLTGEVRYLDYTRAWAEKHAYGIPDGVTTRHADNHNCIPTYLDLYELEPSADKLTAATDTIHRMVDSTKIDDWWWCDALHMAMPPFARLGRLRGDSSYWTKLYQLYNHSKRTRRLWIPSSGLWYRDETFRPGGILSSNGKPVVWSRGNGWVAAAHVKTLKALSNDEYTTTLTQLVTALRPIQRTDGFWNVNLADPQHLPARRRVVRRSSRTPPPTPSRPVCCRAQLICQWRPAPGTGWSRPRSTRTASSATCKGSATAPNRASRSPTTPLPTSVSAPSCWPARSLRH